MSSWPQEKQREGTVKDLGRDGAKGTPCNIMFVGKKKQTPGKDLNVQGVGAGDIVQ